CSAASTTGTRERQAREAAAARDRAPKTGCRFRRPASRWSGRSIRPRSRPARSVAALHWRARPATRVGAEDLKSDSSAESERQLSSSERTLGPEPDAELG